MISPGTGSHKEQGLRNVQSQPIQKLVSRKQVSGNLVRVCVRKCLRYQNRDRSYLIHVFWFLKMCIYLAALGVSCDTLFFVEVGRIFSCSIKLLLAACGIYFPDQGSNLGPSRWEHGFLATRPPGKFFQ